MAGLMDFLKRPVFRIDGITLTVGLIVLAVLLYWAFFMKRR